MEAIYHYFGIAMFWGLIVIASCIALYFIFKIAVNFLGDIFNFGWVLVEYAFYRNEFKEWVKDKKTNHDY